MSPLISTVCYITNQALPKHRTFLYDPSELQGDILVPGVCPLLPTPASTFPAPNLLLATTAACRSSCWVTITVTRAGTGLLHFPQFKVPVASCCAAPVNASLASCYKLCLPSSGDKSVVLCCSLSDLNKFLLMCLSCDRRHLKYLPKMNNQPLPLQSRGDLPTTVQKLGSNPHLKDR